LQRRSPLARGRSRHAQPNRRYLDSAACDPPIWLAVTTTSLDDAMRAGTRFSQLLNLRVFNDICAHRTAGVNVERSALRPVHFLTQRVIDERPASPSWLRRAALDAERRPPSGRRPSGSEGGRGRSRCRGTRLRTGQDPDFSAKPRRPRPPSQGEWIITRRTDNHRCPSVCKANAAESQADAPQMAHLARSADGRFHALSACS
jgi:hypothetical protein